MNTRVISIGAIDAHPDWGERTPVRTGHATTTLIRAGKKTILIDPGLPAQALGARLGERAGISHDSVTDVFLTSFHPDARRGLALFENANWLIHTAERESLGVNMVQQYQVAEESGDAELAALLRDEISLLKRCQPAPDKFTDHVDLFPLPGVSPGTAGVLVADARHTLLVTGDAIATGEHLDKGRIVQWAADVEQAKESFAEAIEIADLIIPGRDNLILNPTRRPF
ncbi:MAG: MBL fold metallo-hydrolase [Planctomycetota bacterium]